MLPSNDIVQVSPCGRMARSTGASARGSNRPNRRVGELTANPDHATFQLDTGSSA